MLDAKTEDAICAVIQRIDRYRDVAKDPRQTPRKRRMRVTKAWTCERLLALREAWASNTDPKDIAVSLGTTPGAVRTKAQRIGLTKRERYEAAHA